MGNNTFDFSEIYPFVKIDNPAVILPILESRLPISSLLYNSAKIFLRNAENGNSNGTSAFYTIDGDVDETCWIIFIHYREDFGKVHLISADQNKSKLSREDVCEIFSKSKLINFYEPYFICSVEKWISSILLEIGLNMIGSILEVHPCLMYHMEIKDALALELDTSIPNQEANMSVQALDPVLGTKFIMKTWKYAVKTSEAHAIIKRGIELNESGGVYLDGNPVCGIITHDFGMLSALYTLPEHRGKGYAIAAMKFAFKEQAKNHLIPTTTVEMLNTPSIKFHEKMKCKLICKVDSIMRVSHEF